MQEFTSQTSYAADIISDSLANYPGLYGVASIVLKRIAVALLAASAIYYQYNYGNGIWIGVLTVFPFAGWGSR